MSHLLASSVDLFDPSTWTAAGWAAGASWLTFVTAAAAATYAVRQFGEARRARELQDEIRREQSQPYIVVDVERPVVSAIHLELAVRNTGSTIAYDVKIAFDPPLETAMGRKDATYALEQTAFMRQGIPTMPPGREWSMIFDSGPERFESDLPRQYDITVTFRDARAVEYSMNYRLDFDIYFGLMRFSPKGAHQIAQSLDAVDKTLKRWTRGQSGLRVFTVDEDKRNAEELAAELEWEEKMRDRQAAKVRSAGPSTRRRRGQLSADTES